ncbi:MAG: class I SAM-dependent methyltransferase [Vicinamibacterales bacterium]
MSAHHPPPRRHQTGARTASDDGASFAIRLATARARREALAATFEAYRIIDGAGDGVPGVSLDRYGPWATLNVGEDAGWSDAAVTDAARRSLDVLAPDGVAAIYVKPFARDRSRLGGRLPDESRRPEPRAGVVQPETLVIDEYGARFEVRPYDGLSTGLFLEHREHRRALAARRPARVLNLFAYTCGFAVPLAQGGAAVTNVDVSARYLAWGRRNLALNHLDAARVRFLRRDALDYLRTAGRAGERFDLVILDPPSFGAADPRRGIGAWRAVDDYPGLVRAAVAVLAPGGAVFAATNTRALARDEGLPRLVSAALGRPPQWLALPPWPVDVTDRARVAAVLFAP